MASYNTKKMWFHENKANRNDQNVMMDKQLCVC